MPFHSIIVDSFPLANGMSSIRSKTLLINHVKLVCSTNLTNVSTPQSVQNHKHYTKEHDTITVLREIVVHHSKDGQSNVV